jgi:ABC-type transporter Mla subunit MlaD
MDEIKRQVSRAQRRLVFQQFLFVMGWSLFATLLIAVIGLAVPRIWVIAVDRSTWDWSWIGGGIAAGFAIAGVWTWIIRRSKLDAAIELDRRFGLKERVSSTLALGPEELETEIGQALVTDAVRRVERIDVREQFQVKPTWRALLPLVPAAAMAGVLYFGFATQRAAEATSEQIVKVRDQIKTATQKLQEKIRETEKRAEELGLKDAEALKEINKELDKLANKNTADRKDAMLKINDLAKEIERRKQELGGADKMKKELDKLKDIQNGPADKLAESLKEGDFGKAQEQMKQMKEDLKQGKLSEEDKEKLAKQMEQMKDALKQGVQDAKEAREKLQQEIEKKLAEGNIAEAAKLQQQLDKMNENAEQMEQQMNELADKLGDIAKALQEGDSKAAGEKLDELAQDLDQLQEQLDQIENLNEVLDQLADAKNAMKCEQCGGAGCKACEGSGKEGEGKDGEGKGKGKKKGKGRGLGAGQGEGERPEEETDKSFYDTRVNADAKAGEAVRVGDAGGNNVAGKSKEAVKEAIQGALAKDPDALEDVNLPRDQREHAKQYFEKFRKGE